jgi:hypothetical protein
VRAHFQTATSLCSVSNPLSAANRSVLTSGVMSCPATTPASTSSRPPASEGPPARSVSSPALWSPSPNLQTGETDPRGHCEMFTMTWELQLSRRPSRSQKALAYHSTIACLLDSVHQILALWRIACSESLQNDSLHGCAEKCPHGRSRYAGKKLQDGDVLIHACDARRWFSRDLEDTFLGPRTV